MKKLAFTLAEVLLVIAIIGTVSILTVNNAVKSTGTAEKIVQLKKTYDILNAAIMAGMNDAGNPYKWGYAGSGNNDDDLNKTTIEKVLVPHLKLQKNCGTGTGCWTSTVKPTIYDSNTTINSSTKFYKGILANGASFAIKFVILRGSNHSIDEEQDLVNNFQILTTAIIYIDVDGPNKSSGKLGDDVFAFLLNSHDVPDGLEPLGNKATLTNNSSSHNDTCPANGDFCTAWAFYKGNQDYFTCADKLSWTDPEKSHCPVE